MLEIIKAKTKVKAIRCIESLEWQIKQDISEKDREIHKEAIKTLESMI
ncbi:transcriptional regulator [Clostridium tyrobutyricum]|nr:transcriptional regulator [Clostridium tyrobutyricum]